MKFRTTVLVVLGVLLLPSLALAVRVTGYGINVMISFDKKDIQKLGEKAAHEIESEYGLMKDGALQKRVDSIARIAGASSRYPVKILNVEKVNAFCTFDKRIYVNRELLEFVDDKQLLFALAHEAAHGDYQDPENHLKEVLQFQIGLSRAEMGDSSRIEKMMMDLATGVVEGSYSRKQERRADESAARALWAKYGGVDGGIALLEKLKKLRGGKAPHGLSRYFASHPPEEERIKLITKMQREWAKRLPPPAVKLTHPGKKVMLVFIAKDITVKPSKDYVRALSNELKTQLNAQGTYKFCSYQEVVGESTSIDIASEIQSAKKGGASYLVRLETPEYKLESHSPFFSGKKTLVWQIKFQCGLYGVRNTKLLFELTEVFNYKAKGRDSIKLTEQEKLVEAKFLTDLISRLLAKVAQK